MSPGCFEVRSRGLPANAHGLFDPPERPAQPPKSQNLCFFSSSKTLAIPAVDHAPHALVTVSVRSAVVAGFQVSLSGRFWVSPKRPDLSLLEQVRLLAAEDKAATNRSSHGAAEKAWLMSTEIQLTC